jgi:hypothetical protein
MVKAPTFVRGGMFGGPRDRAGTANLCQRRVHSGQLPRRSRRAGTPTGVPFGRKKPRYVGMRAFAHVRRFLLRVAQHNVRGACGAHDLGRPTDARRPRTWRPAKRGAIRILE